MIHILLGNPPFRCPARIISGLWIALNSGLAISGFFTAVLMRIEISARPLLFYMRYYNFDLIDIPRKAMRTGGPNPNKANPTKPRRLRALSVKIIAWPQIRN